MLIWIKRLVAAAALAGILVAGERIVRELNRDEAAAQAPAGKREPSAEEMLQPARDDLDAHEEEVREMLAHLAAEPRHRGKLMPDSRESLSDAKEVLAGYREYRWPIIAKYREGTKDSEDRQQLAVEFLQEYLETITSDDASLTFHDLASPVLKQDPNTIDDPVIACHVARCLYEQGDQDAAAQKLLDRHIPALTAENSTAEFRARVQCWLIDLAIRQEQNWGIHQDEMFQAIVAMLESNPDPSVDRFHWKLIFPVTQKIGPGPSLRLAGLLAQSDSASIYLTHLLAGWSYVDLGWEARGGGWGSEVTDEQWDGLKVNMEKGARHLHRAFFLHPEIPAAAHVLMSVAQVGRETPLSVDGWFREVLHAQFDHVLAFGKMRTVLRPRWGGSHEQLLEFARETIDTGRWDSAVPYWSWHVLTTIREEVGEEQPFGTQPGVAELAEHFAAAVAKGVEQGMTLGNGFRSDLMPATCAYMGSILIQGRRYQQAKQLFQFLAPPDKPAGFAQLRVNREYLTGLLAAMHDDLTDDVRVLHEKLTSIPRTGINDAWLADLDERLLRIQAARKDGRLGEDTDAFLDDIAAMLNWQTTYARGEWVEPEFKPGMPGWYHEAAETEIVDARTVRLKSTARSSGVQMRPLTEFNIPFVVEAQITLKDDRKKQYMAGVIVGPGDQHVLYGREISRGLLTVSDARDSLLFRTERYGDQSTFPRAPFPSEQDTHTMRIYVWPEVIEYRLDGLRVDVERDIEFQPSRIIRFGQMYPKRAPADIEIGAPRWRKLSIRQIPPTWDGVDHVAYFEERIEFDSNDAEALIRSAALLRAKNELTKARERLDRAAEVAPAHRALPWLRGIIAYNQRRHKDAAGHFAQVDSSRETDYRGASLLGAFFKAAAHEDSLRDPEEAIRMVKPYLDKPGRDYWMSRMTMAAAHATLGNFEEAVKWHLKAAEDAPERYSAQLKRELEDLRKGKPIRIKPTKGDVDFP